MLDKLRKLIKSKEDCVLLIDSLLMRIHDKESISGNPMLDGFIIGLMHSNGAYVLDILRHEKGSVLAFPISDSKIQSLEQIIIWLCNNETKVIKQFKYAQKPQSIDKYIKTSVKNLEFTITDYINDSVKKFNLEMSE